MNFATVPAFFIFSAWREIVDEQFWDPPALKTPGCPEGMEIPFAMRYATISGGCTFAHRLRLVWLGSSNRGEQHLVGWGIQRGQRSRWQWFPKAAELPWQEESNETRGFVAHDFSRKV